METFYIFTIIAFLGIVGYGFQVWAVRSKIEEEKDNKEYCPPISILKPLKGIDDNLFDNLESFCTQDYPEYEVILAIQDYNDPAYRTAKKIAEKYPEKVKLLVEKCQLGLNPKVNNLIPAYRESKYDIVLISDSNVMVEKNYLREIVKNLSDDNVGLVTNIIRGTGGLSLGAKLENLHLNTFIISSVCFLDRFLKMPCVIGKSMLMRKKDIEAIGGLEAFKDFLAEDYVIGYNIHKSGKRVVLSSYTIDNVNEYWEVKKFLNRHTRWGKLRWKIGGGKYLSEMLGNPVFMSIISLVLNISWFTFFFALWISLVKILFDIYLGNLIKTEMNKKVYLLSPFKDIIIGILWFVPLLSNTVVWRGNRYKIGKHSLLLPYEYSGILAWRYRIISAIKERFA